MKSSRWKILSNYDFANDLLSYRNMVFLLPKWHRNLVSSTEFLKGSKGKTRSFKIAVSFFLIETVALWHLRPVMYIVGKLQHASPFQVLFVNYIPSIFLVTDWFPSKIPSKGPSSKGSERTSLPVMKHINIMYIIIMTGITVCKEWPRDNRYSVSKGTSSGAFTAKTQTQDYASTSQITRASRILSKSY